MSWTNNTIDQREAILSYLLNYPKNEVLNKVNNGSSPQNKKLLAVKLKIIVNQLKTEGMNINDTNVDYQLIAKSKPYQQFCELYTSQLIQFDPNILETRAERLAFWVNLYNVLVIDSVIRFDIDKSVTDGFLGILKFFRRAAYNINGLRVSLEDIEHGILRGNQGNPYIPGPQFGISDPRRFWVITPFEPRIHFAINCASRSCPPIDVYDFNTIDSQLNLAASNFIRQETKIDQQNNTIITSQIFNWFKKDFGGRNDTIKFIQHYLSHEFPNDFGQDSDNYKLKFNQYDWQLNI